MTFGISPYFELYNIADVPPFECPMRVVTMCPFARRNSATLWISSASCSNPPTRISPSLSPFPEKSKRSDEIVNAAATVGRKSPFRIVRVP
jgi:hypothetical protein